MGQDGARRGPLDIFETESWPEACNSLSLSALVWVVWLVWALRSLQSSMGLAAPCFYSVSPLNCTSPAQHAKVANSSKIFNFTIAIHYLRQNKVAPAEMPHWMGVRPIDVALFENGVVCLPQPAFGSLPIPAINLMSFLNLKQHLQHRRISLKWSCQSPRWCPASMVWAKKT